MNCQACGLDVVPQKALAGLGRSGDSYRDSGFILRCPECNAIIRDSTPNLELAPASNLRVIDGGGGSRRAQPNNDDAPLDAIDVIRKRLAYVDSQITILRVLESEQRQLRAMLAVVDGAPLELA